MNSLNWKKSVLFFAICTNLTPLIYFKYSNFLNLSSEQFVLPLAISFFTFQQIAFLLDLYRNKIKFDGFKEYLFFILFFPQLVAGPIVHYYEMIPQIKDKFKSKINESYIITGLVLFSIGLFKKVVFADNFAVISDGAFSNIDMLSSYDAWIGIFSYSFQIYFDFNGYADMALGLALLFGIKLPINFNSPYKARNISEFWRNWHISLSRFLKDYIYIPLGGSRVVFARQSLNLIATMVIGGIWHGAGWNFLIWGFMHGVFLAVTHFFKNIFKRDVFLPKYFSIALTFLLVTLLWVLFRAESFEVAVAYYNILFSFDFNFNKDLNSFLKIVYSNEFLVICGFIFVWFMPNSLQICDYFKDEYKISYKKVLFGAVLFFIALKSMASKAAVSFVYFNF